MNQAIRSRVAGHQDTARKLMCSWCGAGGGARRKHWWGAKCRGRKELGSKESGCKCQTAEGGWWRPFLWGRTLTGMHMHYFKLTAARGQSEVM